uniref:LRRCT domain-containing protein n=1 Tax=Sinocyclocheilus grahami TaxID=75366 RepID=A0A672P4L0_SINGR
MLKIYALLKTVLHSCLAYKQSVSHPGKCRLVFRSDEVQVICASVNFKQLPSKDFPGNTTDLSVRFSNLSSITSDDLKILSHLRQLSLIRNQLRTLPADLLLGLSNLHALYLENNRLKSLAASAFIGNPNLRQMFLSGNRLESLPAGIFLKQDELVFLDLRNNYLQNLTPGTLDGRLYAVLSGNPWHCNSSLAYLWHWLRMNKKRIVHDDTITCQTPEHMKGRNITEIAAAELCVLRNPLCVL